MVLRRQHSEPSVNQGDPLPSVICEDGLYPDSEDMESDPELEVELEDLDFEEEEADLEEAIEFIDELSDVSGVIHPLQSSVGSNLQMDYDGEPIDVAPIPSCLPDAEESGCYVPSRPPPPPAPSFPPYYGDGHGTQHPGFWPPRAPMDDRVFMDLTIHPYMPRLERPVALPPHRTYPSLYAFADHPCFDQPGPSQPVPQRPSAPEPDMAGPSGTKHEDHTPSADEDKERIPQFKKAVEFRVRELAKDIDRTQRQGQTIYIDFLQAVQQLYLDYDDDGMNLSEIYDVDEWHEFMASEVLPFTPMWQIGLREYFRGAPAVDIPEWISDVTEYVYIVFRK